VVTTELVISEIGLDMTRWKSTKHVASFLGPCPHHRISGGKVLKRGTRKGKNCAATALRVAAQSLRRSQTALGAKFRRLKGRQGAPKATMAMAHTLLRLVCRMLRYGQECVEQGRQAYDGNYHQYRIQWIEKEARTLNPILAPAAPAL
jgi:transposase